MPMDLAPPLFLSQDVFRVPASCLRFPQPDVDPRGPAGPGSPPGPPPEAPGPSGAGPEGAGRKKRVTFADARGLALSRVKVFSPFLDPIAVPPSAAAPPPPSPPAVPPQEDRLVLDFEQPSRDYVGFRQQLERDGVRLERCELRDGALSGSVRVLNLGYEKSVELRLSWDGWASQRDEACAHLRDAYPSVHWDTFSFRVPLPPLRPPQGLEFAVRYRAAGGEYWDSNHGDNYRLVWASAGGGRRPSRDPLDLGIHFDRYGSPTCSHGLCPDWPSWDQDAGPYY